MDTDLMQNLAIIILGITLIIHEASHVLTARMVKRAADRSAKARLGIPQGTFARQWDGQGDPLHPDRPPKRGDTVKDTRRG